MSLDLAFNEEQQAIADAVRRFCESRCTDEVVKNSTGKFPTKLWQEMAEMGLLAVATPEAEGGALTVCAIMEALGEAVFPGPLVGSFLATQLLDQSDREGLVEGRLIASVGDGLLMPWGQQADIFVVIEGKQMWRAETLQPGQDIEVLGGESWVRFEPGQLQRKQALNGCEQALTIAEVGTASYLSSAAQRLVNDASEYTQTRQQFKKPLANFQAVAHPLADCHTRLTSARVLARAAAWQFDQAEIDASKFAAAARISATAAAVQTIHVCHQIFGAIGITLEGPVYHISRRIRQLASTPPDQNLSRETLLQQIGMGATI